MCACMCTFDLPACLPPFLPADFNEQAGRNPRVFTIKCAPEGGV